MKKYFLLIIVSLPILTLGQSSASSEFEFEFVLEKTKEDFDNIELFYISQTGPSSITSCRYSIDSLENKPNLCLIKFYGSYRYTGGVKAVFPTIIITEKQNNGNLDIDYNIVHTYMINLKYSPQKKINENLSNEQNKKLIGVKLNSNLPIMNVYRNETEEIQLKYYSFDQIESTLFDSEEQNFNLDFFTWRKIFSE